MFESILKYVTSKDFAPKASIATNDLKQYLLEKGRSKRIKERRMTQFWQIDTMSLQSRKYAAESEQYLREDE